MTYALIDERDDVDPTNIGNANLQTPDHSKAMPGDDVQCIALAEIITALSLALDLTEDAMPGHSVRSCLLGTRIGHALGLCETELGDLYYSLLLKDVGCSSNAGRMCQILGGDERKAKRQAKTIDWTRPTLDSFKFAWSNAVPDAPLVDRIQRVTKLSLHQDQNNQEVIELRCERGANIARKIGFSEKCSEAIRSLDEHWDGRGYPDQLKGSAISILARILGVAQHLDVFTSEFSRKRAIDTLINRSGTWFDPALVQIAVSLDREGLLWTGVGMPDERSMVVKLEPGIVRLVDDEKVDLICEGFADIVDAKSSFTYYHSLNVAKVALGIAWQLGLESDERRLIYRASLLHDLGKLRVPNTILDKPDKLNEAEWLIMREHPLFSQRILEQIPSFAAIARIAGRHHEKLDGSGYPHGLKSEDLSLHDRIVAIADIYGALSEDRPYRKGLPPEQIIAIMERDTPNKLDRLCFQALLAFIELEHYASLKLPAIK